MKQIIIIVAAITFVILAILLVLRTLSNNRSANQTPPIPDGITKEEHESHHPELYNNQ